MVFITVQKNQNEENSKQKTSLNIERSIPKVGIQSERTNIMLNIIVSTKEVTTNKKEYNVPPRNEGKQNWTMNKSISYDGQESP